MSGASHFTSAHINDCFLASVENPSSQVLISLLKCTQWSKIVSFSFTCKGCFLSRRGGFPPGGIWKAEVFKWSQYGAPQQWVWEVRGRKSRKRKREREKKQPKQKTKKRILNQNRFWESTLNWGWSQSCNKLDVRAEPYWRQWGFCHWLRRGPDSILSLHRAVGVPAALCSQRDYWCAQS